jgi:UDP-GlcNAc:undecaprenyl-phosphate GlcNAc-1-phosphate transferase
MKLTLLLLPAAAAGALAYLLTPAVCALARRIGALDPPGPRKVHDRVIPRLGGAAVVPAIVAVLAALFLVDVPGYPHLSPGLCIALTAGLLPVFVVSSWDDIRPLRPATKFIGQFAGALIAVACGVHLNDAVHLFGLTIPLDGFAVPLSVLWIVGVTNAFNIIDGLDGLSAGLGLISSASLATIAVMTPNPEVAVLSSIILGALVGFMPYNMYPARVFLGDSGAAAVGFYLACLALPGGATLSSGMAVLVPLLAMGVPIADTCLSIARRSLRGLQRGAVFGLFEADSEHIHHRLVRMGLDHRRAVLILYGAALGAAAIGILSLFVTASNAALLLATVVAAAFIGVGRLGYDEFAVLRRGVVLRMYDAPVLKIGLFRVFVDIALVMAAFYGAVALKYDDWDLHVYRALLLNCLSVLLPLTVATFWAFRLYQRSWRFAGIEDVVGANLAALASAGGGFVLARLVVDPQISGTLFLTYVSLLMVLVSAARSSFRVLAYAKESGRKDGRRVAIYGAGVGGTMALREIHSNEALRMHAVGFIDDDPRKAGRRVNGYPVLGSGSDLETLARTLRLDAVILASNKIPADRVHLAMLACHATDVDVLRFSVDIHSLRMSPVSAHAVGLASAAL